MSSKVAASNGPQAGPASVDLRCAATVLESRAFTALDERNARIHHIRCLCDLPGGRGAEIAAALSTAFFSKSLGKWKTNETTLGWEWERSGKAVGESGDGAAVAKPLQNAVAIVYASLMALPIHDDNGDVAAPPASAAAASAASHVRTCCILVEGGALNLLCTFAANAVAENSARASSAFNVVFEVVAEIARCAHASEHCDEAPSEARALRAAMAAERARAATLSATAAAAAAAAVPRNSTIAFLQRLTRSLGKSSAVPVLESDDDSVPSHLKRIYWQKTNVMRVASALKQLAVRADGDFTLTRIVACRALASLAELHTFFGWALLTVAEMLRARLRVQGSVNAVAGTTKSAAADNDEGLDMSWILSLVTREGARAEDSCATGEDRRPRFSIALTLVARLAGRPMNRELFQTQLMNSRSRWAALWFQEIGFFKWPMESAVGGARGTTVAMSGGSDSDSLNEEVVVETIQPEAEGGGGDDNIDVAALCGGGGDDESGGEPTKEVELGGVLLSPTTSEQSRGDQTEAAAEGNKESEAGAENVFADDAELQSSLWGMLCDLLQQNASDLRVREQCLKTLALLLFLEPWVFDAKQRPRSMPNELEQQCIVDEALVSFEDCNLLERNAGPEFYSKKKAGAGGGKKKGKKRGKGKRRKSWDVLLSPTTKSGKDAAAANDAPVLCVHPEFYSLLAHASTLLWVLSNFNRDHAELLVRHKMRASRSKSPKVTLHVSLQRRIRRLYGRWKCHGATTLAYLAFHASALRIIEELTEVGRDCKNRVNELSEPWEIIPSGIEGEEGTAVLTRGLSLLLQIVDGNSEAAADLASDYESGAPSLWMNALLETVSTSFCDQPLLVERTLSLLATLASHIAYPEDAIARQAASYVSEEEGSRSEGEGVLATGNELTCVALHRVLHLGVTSMLRFPSDHMLVEQGARAIECASACIAQTMSIIRSATKAELPSKVADSSNSARRIFLESALRCASGESWDTRVQNDAKDAVRPIVSGMLRFKSLEDAQTAGIAALLNIANLLDTCEDGASHALIEQGAHLVALDAMRIRPAVHSIQNRGNSLLARVRILEFWRSSEEELARSGQRRRRARWFAVAVAREGAGLEVFETVGPVTSGKQQSIGAGQALAWLSSSSVRWNIFRTRSDADAWLNTFRTEQLTPKWQGLFQWQKEPSPTSGATTATMLSGSVALPTPFNGKIKGIIGAPPPFSRSVAVESDQMPWALQLIEGSCFCIGCGAAVKECCREASTLHFPDTFDWYHGYAEDEPESAMKRIDAIFRPSSGIGFSLHQRVLGTKLRALGPLFGALEKPIIPFWCASCWEEWVDTIRRSAIARKTQMPHLNRFTNAVDDFMSKCSFVYSELMRPRSLMNAITANARNKVSLVQFSLAIDAFLFAADIALRDDISILRWALLLSGPAESKTTAIKGAGFLDTHPFDFFALASAMGMVCGLPITAAHFSRDELNIGVAPDGGGVKRDADAEAEAEAFLASLQRHGFAASKAGDGEEGAETEGGTEGEEDAARAMGYQDFIAEHARQALESVASSTPHAWSSVGIMQRKGHYPLITAAALEVEKLEAAWRDDDPPFGREETPPDTLTEWLHVREYVVSYLQGDPEKLIERTRSCLTAGACLLQDLSLAMSRDEVVQEITDVGLVNTPFFNLPHFTQHPPALIRRFGTVRGFMLMSLPTMLFANIFCWALAYKSVMSSDKGDPLLSSKAWDGLGRAHAARGRNKARVVLKAWRRLLCELAFVPFKTCTPILILLSFVVPISLFLVTNVVSFDLNKSIDLIIVRVIVCVVYTIFFGLLAVSFGWVAVLAIFDEGTEKSFVVCDLLPSPLSTRLTLDSISFIRTLSPTLARLL